MPTLIASVLAGALAVLGFAPLQLYPLPLLALTLLFVLLARTSSMRAGFLIGLAFGLGLFGAGVSWVYISLSVYGGMPAWLAALATLLFCVVLALFPAVAGALQARCCDDRAMRLLLVLPALWTLAEWTRGWMFTGFPWLTMGYSQVPHGPLAGFAPLVGVYGVSLLLALAAGLLAWIALGWRRRARLGLGIAGLAVLLAGGQVLRNVDWTTPAGQPTSVALLQGNVPQEMKWRPDKIVDTLERYLRLAESQRAQLIVLPETALPLFESDLPASYRDRLEAIGRRSGGDLLTGLPTGSLYGAYYNSVVSFGSAPSQYYHKVHLVPFGEFIPLKPLWGWVVTVLHIPLSDFARGSPAQRPLRIGGQRVAANICYEDAFGEEIIRQLPEASVLVNVSNLAWFGDSLSPWQHAQMSQMRALETGRMMLRATNTGVTAIIDAKGHFLAQLPLFSEGVLTGEIQGYAGATPYVRWGNLPALALCFGVLAAAVAASRLRRRP